MTHLRKLSLQALWVSWQPNPATADTASWRLWKLRAPISPLEVVRNGSAALHGVGDEGVSVRGRGGHDWEQLDIRRAAVPLFFMSQSVVDPTA